MADNSQSHGMEPLTTNELLPRRHHPDAQPMASFKRGDGAMWPGKRPFFAGEGGGGAFAASGAERGELPPHYPNNFTISTL